MPTYEVDFDGNFELVECDSMQETIQTARRYVLEAIKEDMGQKSDRYFS